MPPATDWSYLKTRVTPLSRDAVLAVAVELAHRIPGNIIEFGVAEGQSIRAIRDRVRACEAGKAGGESKRIFGCDSFKGLPEKFERLDVGAFACQPPQIDDVEIVEGYFADSLTPELARRVGAVSLAFLDADLYSSTRCALEWLTPLLHAGSLLLFDEFLGEQESEKRAFEDWTSATGVRTVRVAEFMRNPSGCSESRPDSRPLFQVVEPGS